MMTGRERFRRSLQYQPVERIPYFENEIRREVITQWQHQGLASAAELRRRFPCDDYEEIEPHFGLLPPVYKFTIDRRLLNKLPKKLNYRNPLRLPANWLRLRRHSHERQQVLILVVHHGFFLAMGIGDWESFDNLIDLLREQPGLIRRWMEIYGEFTAGLADKILTRIDVDAALFSEPIGGLNGPLISPGMYREFVLSSYRPTLDVLKQHQIPVIIFRTYANARPLISDILKAGMNCLWAYETNSREMDYRDLRREFGRDLRLIGGIDLDALRQDKETIYREIEEKVPPLLASGGYIPTADGRIREDISFENYSYYRELLRKYIQI